MIAQIPDSGNSAQTTPEIEQAKQFAKDFLSRAFSEDYSNAERMMTPEPPQKGTVSKSEFAKRRIAEIDRLVKQRKSVGEVTEWKTTMTGDVHTNSERPSGEQFIDFTFQATHQDGRSTFCTVTVLRKNGQLFIERFKS